MPFHGLYFVDPPRGLGAKAPYAAVDIHTRSYTDFTKKLSKGYCKGLWAPKEEKHAGGCQNYDPFLGTLNIRCRIEIGIQNGTIILTTTHV